MHTSQLGVSGDTWAVCLSAGRFRATQLRITLAGEGGFVLQELTVTNCNLFLFSFIYLLIWGGFLHVKTSRGLVSYEWTRVEQVGSVMLRQMSKTSGQTRRIFLNDRCDLFPLRLSNVSDTRREGK